MILPALSFSCGQSPAHERKCPAVAKWLMSTPISATITDAAVALTPGIVIRRSTAARKGSIAASICASNSLTVCSRCAIICRCCLSKNRWWAVTLPCSAWARVSRDADSCSLPKAASFLASVCPAMIALSIRRPLWPNTSAPTEANFTLASSKHLLNALLVLHHLAHQLLAGTGQIAQLLNRSWRNHARADQPVRQQVCDPGRVVDVAFAPRHVPDVCRVGQDQLELPLQDVPPRLPVTPSSFHSHVGYNPPAAANPRAPTALRWWSQSAAPRGAPHRVRTPVRT